MLIWVLSYQYNQCEYINSSLVDIWLTFWAFQNDMLPLPKHNPQLEIPPRICSVLYDHLQHLSLDFHINLTYKYKHCEAVKQ